MKNGLIVEKSIGALRKAASDGHPFYCCERFEDDYGRLVVGVGARLEGRILQTVAKFLQARHCWCNRARPSWFASSREQP